MNIGPLTRRGIKQHAAALAGIKTPANAAAVLHIPLHRLQLMASQPAYHVFSIPKKDGSLRWIEDPAFHLKTIQQKLNHYLQCLYYVEKTEAAYGFMICPKDDPAPRNIISNAQQHLGMPYMVNMDMEDYFHTVTADKVFRIFTKKPMQCNDEAAALLTSLVTHKERLPMGAPTSPVLSNFAAFGLDRRLLSLSAENYWKYTRYADDMTFSSEIKMQENQLQYIESIVESEGFRLNPEKLKFFNPKDHKTITGLRVTDTGIALPDGYIAQIEKDIEQLKTLHLLRLRHHKIYAPGVLKAIRQQVEGKLNFVAQILGSRNEDYCRLLTLIDEAVNPTDSYESFSWSDFPYF